MIPLGGRDLPFNVEVFFKDFRVCSGYRGQSVREVERKVAAVLGISRSSVSLPLNEVTDDGVTWALVFDELPVLASEELDVELLSGDTMKLAAGLPSGLVYERLARRLGCQACHVRLIFECPCGNAVHDKAAWNSEEHDVTSKRVQAMALHPHAEQEEKYDWW